MLGVVGAVLGLLGGIALAPGARPAVQGVRRRPARQRHRARVPHDLRVAARRHARDRARRALPAIRASRVTPIAALREGVELPRRTAAARRSLAVVICRARRACGRRRVRPGRALRDDRCSSIAIVLVLAAPCACASAAPAALPAHARRSRAASAGSCAGAASPGGSRARTRSASPAARRDRRRADGRPRARHVRLDPRRRHKASINQAVDRSFAGNLIVENSQVSNDGDPRGRRAGAAPGARRRHVTPIAFTVGRLRKGAAATRRSPRSSPLVRARLPDRMGARLERDAARRSANGGTVLDQDLRESHHLKVGQRLAVLTPTGRT